MKQEFISIFFLNDFSNFAKANLTYFALKVDYFIFNISLNALLSTCKQNKVHIHFFMDMYFSVTAFKTEL